MQERADIKAFKNELRNYRFYQSKVKKWDILIQESYDKLGASPKSIDYSRVIMHGAVPNKDFEYKVRDEITFYESKRKPWKDKVDYVDNVLSLIETPLREDIMSVYVKGRSLAEVARPRYIIASSLRGRINRALRRVFDYLDE